ncbi:nuclease-related domain-containing protein [Heyndrickxia acidicola]|uniref:Nuclease-related domain-containing protein n=1 Tax=Heyndrickxia acidicola TaxID=209389 RepID=A0ABU6MIQ1_9BACI|nr:nuclease-related domain-containing protein [Heyndrickxia acidicola]MED1204551.1 nuclease-related domain-containing protein [Heyndrickxia acidicola]
MVVKERKIPIKIQKIEALLRRIPITHPKRPLMEEELAKSYAGYRGEQSLDYHFKFLPEKNYLILHDLRLNNNEHSYFQVDSLLMSSKFLVIIEAKNISGSIIFDDHFNQLIRTINGKEEAFSDPIS